MARRAAVGRARRRLDLVGRLSSGRAGRALRASHWSALALLCLLAGLLGVAAAHSPRWVPPSAVAVPLLIGGWLLRIRSLVVLTAVVALVLLYVETHIPRIVTPGHWLLVGVTAAIMIFL